MSADHSHQKKKIVIIGSSAVDFNYTIPEKILADARFKTLTAICKDFRTRLAQIEGTKDIPAGVLTQIFTAHSAAVEASLKDTMLLEDIKIACKEHSVMPGGGGYNVAKNLEILCARLGIDVEIILVTKLGQESVFDTVGKPTLNIGAQKVRSALVGTCISEIDIAADDPNYRTQVNIALLHAGGRTIIRSPETGITSPNGDGEPGYANPAYGQITHAINGAALVIVQGSKFPFMGAHAARVATHYGIPVLVDYDVTSTSHLEQARELLEHAKYVVAPHDAIAPPRSEGDNADLFTKLVKTDGQYKAHLTAVSNGTEPIIVNTNFHDSRMEVPMKELKVVDKNGAGDLRDAAMAYALLAGYTPLDALRFGSAFSSFGTHYQGRKWADHIEEFFTLYERYKSQTGLHGQSHAQAATP